MIKIIKLRNLKCETSNKNEWTINNLYSKGLWIPENKLDFMRKKLTIYSGKYNCIERSKVERKTFT